MVHGVVYPLCAPAQAALETRLPLARHLAACYNFAASILNTRKGYDMTFLAKQLLPLALALVVSAMLMVAVVAEVRA